METRRPGQTVGAFSVHIFTGKINPCVHNFLHIFGLFCKHLSATCQQPARRNAVMLDDKRQPRRRNLPATIHIVALFVKIALVDAPLAAKRLYLRFAHRKQGIERLEKSIRNCLHPYSNVKTLILLSLTESGP